MKTKTRGPEMRRSEKEMEACRVLCAAALGAKDAPAGIRYGLSDIWGGEWEVVVRKTKGAAKQGGGR